MTKQEFVSRIKQKYPVYNTLSDEMLYQKVIAKYPVYKSQIDDFDTEQTKQGQTGLKGFATGIGKGVASTLKGASSLGEKILQAPFKAVGVGFDKKTAAENLIKPEMTEAQGTAEKIGKTIEQIAEFFVPSSKVAKLEKGLKLLPKAATEAAVIGGQTAIQRGKIDNDAKTAAIIGAIFPVAGAGLSKAKGILKPIGEKIQTTVLRPTSRDLADGFKIENVNKYNLGGSLAQTATKVHVKLNELGQKLQNTLKESNAAINLNKVYQETADDLLQIGKSKQFGDIGATKRVLETLKSEIEEVAGKNGLVDLVEATNIKRGAGTKGAWAFGRVEPDASATENVFTTFYSKIKTAIEKASPADIKGINQQISELIPISNATIRRLPIEQRNNVISLTDSIGLFSSIFDPKALALVGANRLSKSGKFGAFLAELGTKKAAKTALGERIFGGNIADLKDLKAGLSIEDVTKKIADNIDLEDRNLMIKFIDNVRIAKGKSKNLNIEIDGRRMAEAMGFNPDITASKMADIFDNILQWAGERIKIPY